MSAMNGQPKVSVIIPVYNAEKYLRECLDSVVNQTLKDIEIICVDDGSTDQSLSILKKYEKQDSRIRVVQQRNQFAGVARNNGMAVARGKYYVFLDSVDFFEEDLLEEEYSQCEKYEADICLCGADKYDDLKKTYTAMPSWLNTKLLSQDVVNREVLGEDIFKITSGCPWTKMFKASFIQKENLIFQPLPRANDIYFVLCALALADSIVAVKKTLVHYRVGNASSLQANNADTPFAFLDALDAVYARLSIENSTNQMKDAFTSIAFGHIAYNLKSIEKKVNEEEFKKIVSRIKDEYCDKFFLSEKLSWFFSNKGDYHYLLSCNLLDDDSKYYEPKNGRPSKRQPAISFIVPVYNAEEYLVECLTSILNQALHNIELICIDDASTDGSLSIARDFQKKDSRVIVIEHEENKHQGGARNSGLESASGACIWFVDADDYIESDAGEILYNKMKELQTVDVICFDAVAFKEAGNHREDCPERAIRHTWPAYQVIKLPRDEKMLPTTIEGSTVTFLSKRSFLNRFRFRENVFFEDADYSFKVFTSHGSFYFMNGYTPYHRRVTETSTTGKINGVETAECAVSRVVAAGEIARLVDEEDLPEDNYAFVWFTRWAKYVCGLYLNRSEIYQESANEILCSLQHRFDLFPKETMEKHGVVFRDFLRRMEDSLKTGEKSVSQAEQRLQRENTQLRREMDALRSENLAIKPRLEYALSEIDKIHSSWTYRIGRFMTWIPRKIRGLFRCVKEHGWGYTLRRIPEHFGIPMGAMLAKKEPLYKGVSKKKHNPELIVSLTSFPARIGTVHKTIGTILNQTEQPDRVILWLAKEQFPKRIRELPKELLKLRRHGLEIRWCEDIRSYKKLIPTLRECPEAVIVTADDDVYYDTDWLEKLYVSYLKWPDYIHCHRDTRFYMEDGEFKYVPGGKEQYPFPSYLHKLVGIGGVLYPPRGLHPDVMDQERFQKLAKTNDDLWFWFMAIRNGFKIHVVEGNHPAPRCIEETMNGPRLTEINDAGARLFDRDLAQMLETFPEVKSKLLSEWAFASEYERCAAIPPAGKRYDYYRTLSPDLYPANLAEWYHRITGRWLDLDKPKTFDEKIQWMKLYDATPLKTRLADKYLVRDWVREKIGEEYLVPLLGVWDRFDDIDFAALPDQFVLKTNHGCGWNLIVKDKAALDTADAKAKFDEWMNTNFAFKFGLELHYLNIRPKIIAEEYLENGNNDLYDYKVFCFDGKAESIMFLSERKKGLKMAFYDLDWNKLPYTYSYPQNEEDVPKPKDLNLLIRLSEILAEGFPHVRVDFYVLNDGSLKFGEMTFTSASGICKWNPPEQDRVFGNLIQLPPKSPIPERINFSRPVAGSTDD